MILHLLWCDGSLVGVFDTREAAVAASRGLGSCTIEMRKLNEVYV
jgi:hypothetical protein